MKGARAKRYLPYDEIPGGTPWGQPKDPRVGDGWVSVPGGNGGGKNPGGSIGPH